MPHSTVVLRFTLWTSPLSVVSIVRVFQSQRTPLLKMHFLRSVLPRQTSIRCKPSIAKFSSSSINPPFDALLLTITDESDQLLKNNMRIGDDDEGRNNARLSMYSKQEGGNSEFCRTVHEDDTASDSYEMASKKRVTDFVTSRSKGMGGKESVLVSLRVEGNIFLPTLEFLIRSFEELIKYYLLTVFSRLVLEQVTTIRLLECAKKVIAIEIDERIVETLCRRVDDLGLEGKVIVITGNVLKMELPHFDICVSDIPYGIYSPLIAKIFLRSYNSCFRNAIILLQKEFARRLFAKAGESGLLQAICECKIGGIS